MNLTDTQYRSAMRKGWNLTPALYETLWTPILRPYSLGCIERAAPQRGARLLDVATGPGTAALLAADAVGPEGSVLGIDISDRFVEVATARALASGRHNVHFARHPMEAIAVADSSFDAATCVLGLMYGAPVADALGEIERVLVPGGRFAACVWGRRDACGFRDMFPILGDHLRTDLCPLFFGLGVPGALANALQAAGFVDAREERVSLTIAWADRQEACAAVFDGGAGALPFSRFSDDERKAVCDEFIASLEPYRRADGGFDVPAELVYGTARTLHTSH